MQASYAEQPLFFECGEAALAGVLARPAHPRSPGVVIVVGGPQYRVGSHRQFVLLARAIAEAGFPCLRFDLRGMGDSEGERLGFEHAREDIAAAIDTLCAQVPVVDRVVLWGLCDGAAACALYGGTDKRVAGMALFNPWVRTESGAAGAKLQHYYVQRFADRAFWNKLLSGGVNFARSARELVAVLHRASRRTAQPSAPDCGTLPARFAAGLARHAKPLLVVLSGRDLVAAEFRMVAKRERDLARALAAPGAEVIELAAADHTFSSRALSRDAENATLTWLSTLPGRMHVALPA